MTDLLIELFNALALNPLIWFLALLALFVWRATRTNKRWRLLGGGLWLFIWLLSTRPVADLIVGPLEAQYSAPALQTLKAQGVHQVVVLTGGGYPVDGDLLSSGLPSASGSRFMAGIELCSLLGPQCRLIFSGSAGRGNEDIATADVMQGLAHELMPQADAVGESKSADTADHPVNVKPLVRQSPFVVVTSAYHMPRAMLVFHRAGFQPIPYPVDRTVYGNYGWADLLPAPHNFETIKLALHEYVGLLWYSATVKY